MRDLVEPIDRWLAEGLPVALATVTNTWGSAPRGVGATMAVALGSRVAGSVSGGCVEAAVVDTALATLAAGGVQRMDLGVSDETAWSIGLACGGRIGVVVAGLDPHTWAELREVLAVPEPVAVALIVDGPWAYVFGSSLRIFDLR